MLGATRTFTIVRRLPHGEETDVVTVYAHGGPGEPFPGATLSISKAVAFNDAGNPAGHTTYQVPVEEVVSIDVVDDVDPAPAAAVEHASSPMVDGATLADHR